MAIHVSYSRTHSKVSVYVKNKIDFCQKITFLIRMFYLKNKHLTFAEMQHTLDYYIFHLLMHNNKIIHVKKTIGKFKSQQERKKKKICFHIYIYHHKYMPTKNTLHIVYT